jgi:hypothetical protein
MLNKKKKDMVSTFANQAWRLVSGPLTMLMIPLFLTESQQGFWFLFSSLSALAIFADLGFSNIILQFSAHEYAFLSLGEDGELIGDQKHLLRLGSFLRFTLKWILTIGVFVFPVIFAIGIWIFVRDGVVAVYIVPWALFSVGSLLSFVNNSILSYLEGLDKIDEIQRVRLSVAIINTAVIFALLLAKANIYALAIATLVSSLCIFFSIFGTFGKVIRQLWSIGNKDVAEWRKEVIPLFVRYALSFASGYFIFQIYTPLMHYFHGPILGGKVGISLSLVMSVFTMSNIWIYTITPRMNMLVSQKKWDELNSIFRKRLLLSLASFVFIVAGIACFVLLFGHVGIIRKIIGRFLPLNSIIILLVCYFIQLMVNSWATYLRAHKQEPYVIPSILSAIWIGIMTVVVARFFDTSLFFAGFLSSYIWGLPVCFIIYSRLKRKWHAL